MKGITYKNTKTTIPNWVDTIHKDYPRGYAYENLTHFVHMYGVDLRFNSIATGLTAIEKKHGDLRDWVTRVFGAEEIEELDNEIGHSIEGIWRPSLYYYVDSYQALNVTEVEMRLSENSLRLLLQKLDDIFLYIEPSLMSLDTYSHKTRELLILACTEVENFWQHSMKKSGCIPLNNRAFTTKDYVLLGEHMFLSDYVFTLKTYKDVPEIRPFYKWSKTSPTASLTWYNAYNKTKHDKESHFADASLINCINAVVANLILHCVRFSPYPMYEQSNAFSSLYNQHFTGELLNCRSKSFYVPDLSIPSNFRGDLHIFAPRDFSVVKPFIVNKLLL